MRFPIRLSALCIAVAWICLGILALIDKDYLTALVSLSSIVFAAQVAIHLRDLDYARRRAHTQTQTRTDKKDPHP